MVGFALKRLEEDLRGSRSEVVVDQLREELDGRRPVASLADGDSDGRTA